MKLIVAAFWVEDEDEHAAMKNAVGEGVPGIPGSGAVVSFREEIVDGTDFQRTLARFDLSEAAYFDRA